MKCDCGYSFSLGYPASKENQKFRAIDDSNKIGCSRCGKEIIGLTYHRENIYSGEKQYFCETCWISSIPLSHIYVLSEAQRKQRLSQMDEVEKEAYALLMRRYDFMKLIKWVPVFIFFILVVILMRNCF
jgi:hypothetical protein